MSSKVIPPSGLNSKLLVKLYFAVPSGETVILAESPRTTWLNSARIKVTGVSPLKPFCWQRCSTSQSELEFSCTTGDLSWFELNKKRYPLVHIIHTKWANRCHKPEVWKRNVQYVLPDNNNMCWNIQTTEKIIHFETKWSSLISSASRMSFLEPHNTEHFAI